MVDYTITPTAQLNLAADSYAADEQLVPTRNLDDELAMTTPARKYKTNMFPPRGPEGNNIERTEDIEMDSASKFLRGSLESLTGQASNGDLRALSAQVEDLKIVDKEHRRSIANLKQRQDKLNNTAQKSEDLEAFVQENSDAIMQHAETIRESINTTEKLVKKLEGVTRDVQSQGQVAATHFETLKSLIANQRKPTAPRIHQQETYAQKTARVTQKPDGDNPKKHTGNEEPNRNPIKVRDNNHPLLYR